MNKWILWLGLVSASAFAHNQFAIIDKPFDMAAFTQCQSYINQCDLMGPFRNAKCVKKTVQRNAACEQVEKLSAQTDVTGDHIAAEKMGNLTLVTLYYPADGQVQYHVLSTDGYLYDLNIDSRTIDKKLAAQYHDQPFFTMAAEKPVYHKSRLGEQEIIVTQKITKQCLACAAIGHATVRFNFDARGRYSTVQLVRHFGKELPPAHQPPAPKSEN